MAKTLAGPTNLPTRGITRRIPRRNTSRSSMPCSICAVFNLQSCAIADR
jgi:hypothetical protein